MLVSMGIIKNKFGVYQVRKKVPQKLEAAVAVVMGNGKSRQSWLKRSLATKDREEAKVRAKPILIDFDQTLSRASALLKAKPVRTSLTHVEIRRIAEGFYANILEEDDEMRRDGTGSEAVFQNVERQLSKGGAKFATPFQNNGAPGYGLSAREMHKIDETLDMVLPEAKSALARGDISFVQDELDDLLDVFQINLDRSGAGYRQVGLELLKANVTALSDLQRRHAGEVVVTPLQSEIEINPQTEGQSLIAAFDGWNKERSRPAGTLQEYKRAIDFFIQLHGDLPVHAIKKSHVRTFREALQDVPKVRAGKLLKASLPELAQWGREHPATTKVSAGSVNKQLGGVQAVARWAHEKGLIPEDVRWSDPFSGMRLQEDESSRGSFEVADLKSLFAAPVFMECHRPVGGGGEAAFWLPLLGLLTGARLGELAGLSTADIQLDAASGVTTITFSEDRKRGRRLKNRSSQRLVPVHPELIRIGFLRYVAQQANGGDNKVWLFPKVSPEAPNGVKAWSKWFGQHLRRLKIKDDANKVFHSFRHSFIDAMRTARVGEELSFALVGHGKGSVHQAYGAKDVKSHPTPTPFRVQFRPPQVGLERAYPCSA